eukprot:TRINITY_DN42_c0_g2_i1.p1 TRINITY_DN42_c0_g2~~TRINITY_DN42_c0_g2_i1.p1  ORF type:complete len:444 (+),score=146.51 TRINITY_DN42_c0_g2_i1:110-1441(+)
MTSSPGTAQLLGSEGDSARFIKQKKLQKEKGARGECYLVVDTEKPASSDGKSPQYVMKVMDIPQMTHRDLRSVMSEIRCMSLLEHANVLRYIADFQCGESLLIVMEYAECGDLEKQIKSRAQKNMEYFKEHEAFMVSLQMFLALDHVHGKRMLHRNLKTANVFLSGQGLVKLGDFGHSSAYQETVSNVVAGTFCGTPVYLPPELWERKRYSKKADIWSLGVIFYEILALRRPYSSPNMRELRKKILHEEFPPPPPHFSDEIIHLASFILQKDPVRRPNMRDILRVAHAQQGLQNLGATVTRNPHIDAKDKECMLKHIESLIDEQRTPQRGAGVHDGAAEVRALGADGTVQWQPRWLLLNETELCIFADKEASRPETVFKIEEIANCCPVGPQESGEEAPIWSIFGDDGCGFWLRSASHEDANLWMDTLLARTEKADTLPESTG